jgi:hypothetical protein
MNEKMKSMEETVEKVRRRKTIFYAIVEVQYTKMYIGIMFPQIYIFSDTLRESCTGMHVTQMYNLTTNASNYLN